MAADADPRSVSKVLSGGHVSRAVGQRICAVLERVGLFPLATEHRREGETDAQD